MVEIVMNLKTAIATAFNTENTEPQRARRKSLGSPDRRVLNAIQLSVLSVLFSVFSVSNEVFRMNQTTTPSFRRTPEPSTFLDPGLRRDDEFQHE
jgi:hypothetical protein